MGYRKRKMIFNFKLNLIMKIRFGFFIILFCAMAVLYISGCAVVQPVDRERLADPNMIFDENPIEKGVQNHYLYIREGTQGADGAKSGGCGCG